MKLKVGKALPKRVLVFSIHYTKDDGNSTVQSCLTAGARAKRVRRALVPSSRSQDWCGIFSLGAARPIRPKPSRRRRRRLQSRAHIPS
jgi:hypothetical protein